MINYKTNLNCNLNEFHNWNITDKHAVFEKTWSATQKNVKSHVFLDFEKKTYVDSQAT